MSFVKTACHTVELEPTPAQGAGKKTVPDLRFRDANKQPMSPTKDEYETLDVIIGAMTWSSINGIKTSTDTHHVWSHNYNLKHNKHAQYKCMPFPVTTAGAIDPRAILWLEKCAANCTTTVKLRTIIKNIVKEIWRVNASMFHSSRVDFCTSYNSSILPDWLLTRH